MQKLIQPINKAVISASFLNLNYEKKFGFKHYGVDMFGELQAWCQGAGIVTAKGTDSLYGNFVQIMYPDCIKFILPNFIKSNILVNYFHLASFGPNIQTGCFVNKDTKLGIIGATGTHANGIHLHIEARPYETNTVRMCSPFASQYFKKNLYDDWFNILDFTYLKGSSPDYQTRSFQNDVYTNEYDRNNILID